HRAVRAAVVESGLPRIPACRQRLKPSPIRPARGMAPRAGSVHSARKPGDLPMPETTASTTAHRSAPVTFTVDEAFAYGVQQHQAGHLDEAEKVYAAVLERRPDRADVLNVLGILKHQRGDLAAAAALMR